MKCEPPGATCPVGTSSAPCKSSSPGHGPRSSAATRWEDLTPDPCRLPLVLSFKPSVPFLLRAGRQSQTCRPKYTVFGKQVNVSSGKCLPDYWLTDSALVLAAVLVFLQLDNDYISIRIPYVFADVYMPFHPGNTSCFNLNFLAPAIRKYETPLE